MNKTFKKSLLGGAVALACSNALGAEHWLCAGTFNKTMPDNTTVLMWGYVDVSDINTNPTHTCPANGDAAYKSPGAQLTVSDPSLTIHLHNNLTEPTSLVIPGQTETAMSPVMNGNRVRSFTHEAVAGGDDTYTWNNLRPGTYAYQTGTHPAKQVQMGLFGGIVKDAAVGEAYPGVAYSSQVVEFLSEIDPVLHIRVANGSYGSPCTNAAEQNANPCSSTIGYNPQWFMVNGEVFVDPSPAAPQTTLVGDANQPTLIRFINMGLRSHTMVLQGASMKIVAEDGHVLPAPHNQYSLMVAAGKTQDALFTPIATGVYPLYERMHSLAAKSAGVIKTGGMMSFLEVVASVNLNAVDDVFSGGEDTAISGNVLTNDTNTVGGQAILDAGPSGFGLNTDGSFSYAAPANFNGHISFTYHIQDGATSSNVATVDLNIQPVNDTPDITTTSLAGATEDTAYTSTVSATDADIADTPPQTLSYSLVTAPAGMTINASTGEISWTPTNAQVGDNNVTVKVTDSSGAANNSATQTFTVVAVNTNDAPTLNFIPTQNAVVGTAFNLAVVGNDIDVGDTLTYSISDNPDWLTINSTGALSGISGAVGVHTVTVTLTDLAGAFSSQTFTLNVTAAPITPTLYFSTLGDTNPTGVTGTADNADIYSWNGTAFARVVDASTKGVPLAANADEIKIVDATHFYMSFDGNTTLSGIGTVQDEDIVYYNGTSWSVFFDATAPGLTNNNHDIDAFDIVGNTVYFSMSGSTNNPGASNPPGVTGTADNADIYAWNGASFSRIVDMSTIGIAAAPNSGSAANVDALKFVDPTHFYVSFAGNVTLPVIGIVQDEDVVYYNNGAWSVYFDGTTAPKNLTSGNHDIDGLDIKPLP